jgi:hypothetical protein
MEKISAFVGHVIGSLLTEQPLALWILAGRPDLALVLATVKALV